VIFLKKNTKKEIGATALLTGPCGALPALANKAQIKRLIVKKENKSPQ
jgi:hypothetical protein